MKWSGISTDSMKEQILSCLDPAYPWKDRFIYLPATDSTNDRLKVLAREGAPHGTAILAGYQTAGHGRRGRTFQSPDGMGIYLSILLRPECAPEDLMHLTCAAGLAMCDAMERSVGVCPGIKWTNDLVLGSRKLGGILTELGFSPQGKLSYAIVGIGINCRQSLDDFPEEIREIATSLSAATGKQVECAPVAAAMLNALWLMAENLLSGREGILARYREKCITIGREISILSPTSVRYGKALDVDDNGALLVAFRDGSIEAVNAGEVSIRGMYGYVR